jgi:peptidoglycan hydrolase-like protein with peptidoglycan-binding domain
VHIETTGDETRGTDMTQAAVPDEIGADDVIPQETDNGPRPGDGTIEEQSSVLLPAAPGGGRHRVTGVRARDVLAAAAFHLGTIEDPVGSNRQPFGQRYGMNGVAWCNIFVSEMGCQASGDYELLGKYAWTPACAQWWRQQGRFGSEPRPGAVVFFDWGQSRSIQAIDHVGLVVQPLGNGLVRTIEGNSSVPGHSDGVWFHDRNPAFVVGYGYPAYGGEEVHVQTVVADVGYHPYATAGSGSRILRILDAGDDVKELQRLLKVAADGYFGARTKNAVLAYQRAHHLDVDGEVGPQVWGALLGSKVHTGSGGGGGGGKGGTKDVPPFPGTVKRGSRGPGVRAVQARLAARGWKVTADGDFGPATEAVVRAFQKEKHLGVDGIVGPQTWAALWRAAVT